MTVSHSSQLINIHIISDDNPTRSETRQIFSVKDSPVQTSNTYLKSSFELYFTAFWKITWQIMWDILLAF